MLTSYAPSGYLLEAQPNPRPSPNLKLTPNRISDPDPNRNPNQVCLLEAQPTRAPAARYSLIYWYLSTYYACDLSIYFLYLLTGAFDYCGSHCVWHLAVVAAVVLMDQACQQLTLTLASQP